MSAGLDNQTWVSACPNLFLCYWRRWVRRTVTIVLHCVYLTRCCCCCCGVGSILFIIGAQASMCQCSTVNLLEISVCETVGKTFLEPLTGHDSDLSVINYETFLLISNVVVFLNSNVSWGEFWTVSDDGINGCVPAKWFDFVRIYVLFYL